MVGPQHAGYSSGQLHAADYVDSLPHVLVTTKPERERGLWVDSGLVGFGVTSTPECAVTAATYQRAARCVADDFIADLPRTYRNCQPCAAHIGKFAAAVPLPPLPELCPVAPCSCSDQ